MQIAVPIAEGQLARHFGHCAQFAVFEVDAENRHIVSEDVLDAPPHQPGLLPVWLKEHGVDLVIAFTAELF